MRATMEVTIIRTDAALTALADEWLQLWRRSPDATPFQSPMWLLPWWRHFGSNELQVITLRDGGKLEALAPLYVLRDDSESLGLFLGTGVSDYLDVLATREQCEVIIDALTKIDCQMWDLQQLRPNIPILETPSPDGWHENVEDQDPCLVLSLENFQTSTHFKKKLRYYQRQGQFTFQEASAENIDSMLQSLFELHGARWQRRGMPGMLADDVIQQFHRDVAQAILDAGPLPMRARRRGGRVLAVFYRFAHPERVYNDRCSYDPKGGAAGAGRPTQRITART